jgi:hypothetical protein
LDLNDNPQETGFEVRIKAAGGKYTFYSVEPNTDEFLVFGLQKNTTYFWNVRAKGDKIKTTDSSWASQGQGRSFQTGD